MAQERRKVKKTKKGKTIVTQKVTVNIGKGGRGRKPSGPPQPSQAERMLQMLTPLLKQQPMVQTNQPIQPSTFNQQSLEAILQRLIPREGPQGPPGPPGQQGQQGPPGLQGLQGLPPTIQIPPLSPRRRIPSSPPSSPLSSGVYPPPGMGWRTPSLESQSGESLSSFAFDFPHIGTGRGFILDQPDSPLVSPAQPAFAGGPQRLDPSHEDVPLRQLGIDEEGVGEGKQEEKQEEQEPIPYLSPNEVPPIKFITKEFLNKAPNTSKQKGAKVTLRMIANSYDIPLSGKMLKSSKQDISNYLWSEIQKKK